MNKKRKRWSKAARAAQSARLKEAWKHKTKKKSSISAKPTMDKGEFLATCSLCYDILTKLGE